MSHFLSSDPTFQNFLFPFWGYVSESLFWKSALGLPWTKALLGKSMFSCLRTHTKTLQSHSCGPPDAGMHSSMQKDQERKESSPQFPCWHQLLPLVRRAAALRFSHSWRERKKVKPKKPLTLANGLPFFLSFFYRSVGNSGLMFFSTAMKVRDLFLGEQQWTLLKSMTMSLIPVASPVVPHPGKLPGFSDIPLCEMQSWCIPAPQRHWVPGKLKGKESVDVSGEVCVGETCQGLCGVSGTTFSLGDFCAISKVIILVNNLTCRYRSQICLHSEIQNEAISLLSYLSQYFQDYTLEWGCFGFFSLQSIWKYVFLLQYFWGLMFCLPVRLLFLLCHVVKNHLPLEQEA